MRGKSIPQIASGETLPNPTFGNICLSVRCIRRFCGVEHILSQPSTKQLYCKNLSPMHPSPGHRTHRLFPFCPPSLVQGIMILTDMKPKEMLRRKVMSAFGASMCMTFLVMDLEVLKGIKGYDLSMRWERAFHGGPCRTALT